MKAQVVWQEGMTFDARLEGFNFLIDADASVGGNDRGPRPKGLTLVSLAGCTAMDVISILRKMKVDVDRFEVATEAELVEEHPKKFKSITIRYILEGKNIPPEKVSKAVSLSEERYCGVSASLRPGVEIASEIVINGEKIQVGQPAPAD